MIFDEKYGIKKNFCFDEKTIKRIDEIKNRLEEERGCKISECSIIKEALKHLHSKITQ